MKYLPLIVLFILPLLLAGMAKADTAISNCGDVLGTGYNYLTGDINDSIGSYGSCLYIGYYQTLDCKGHVIDGNGSYMENAITFPFSYSAYSTVKNCVFRNFYQGVFGEQAGTETIDNNTFYSLVSGAFLYLGDGTKVTNNRFDYIVGAGVTLSGSLGNNNTVSGNYFSPSNGFAIDFSSGTSQDNLVYNNYFGNGASSILISGTPNFWNVSKFIGQNIVGTNLLGGNFFGTCTDENCTGFCDDPKVLDMNNIDQLPLSGCVSPPSPPINNNTWDLSIMKSCTSPSSLQTVKVIGYFTGSGTASANLTFSEFCQFGCNNQTVPNECNISKQQATAWFFGIVVALLLIAFITIYLLTKKR
jgi:hypothetical protein